MLLPLLSPTAEVCEQAKQTLRRLHNDHSNDNLENSLPQPASLEFLVRGSSSPARAVTTSPGGSGGTSYFRCATVGVQVAPEP